MIVNVKLKKTDGSQVSFTNLLSFVFEKEAYTPYTTFKATVYGKNLPEDFTEIQFYINGKVLHHGTVDTFKRVYEKNGI